jgi:hypothetical protein
VPSTFCLPSKRTRRCPTDEPAAGQAVSATSERASRTAVTIFRYPVQRQSTPPKPSITSASDGEALRSSNAVAETSMPGVQAPHCAAPCRRNDSCRRAKIGGRDFNPSTVVMARPSIWPTATRHAQTGSPSNRTVHAPQSPASQPTFVPVNPRCSRKTRERRCAGGAAIETSRSFTTNLTTHLVSDAGAMLAITNSPHTHPERAEPDAKLRRVGKQPWRECLRWGINS